MGAVLAVPHYNEYDQEVGKISQINRDHWSILNPKIPAPSFTQEIQRLWERFLVGNIPS